MSSNLCASVGCHQKNEVLCQHCSQFYCYLCLRCHRQNLFDEMQMLSEQMFTNRQQGVAEVVSFINRQADDAHQQAKQLLDDAIEQIHKAKEKIFDDIERSRQAKIRLLRESVQTLDQQSIKLRRNLSQQICIPASELIQLRHRYAYNMFDPPTDSARIYENERERFFDNYRYFQDMMCLREKWPFLQEALATVYFATKKDFSLDQIITLLEYRHDRVLENYRNYLSSKDEYQNLSTVQLFNALSFLPKQQSFDDTLNFTDIDHEQEQTAKRRHRNKC